MPAVVPQLKTITVGGAAAGVGIEATSFRAGLVHDTMLELEVLLPDGEIVVCTADNEHRDLFFGFPNSYGTLGYALRLQLADASPSRACVEVRHERCTDAGGVLRALWRRRARTRRRTSSTASCSTVGRSCSTAPASSIARRRPATTRRAHLLPVAARARTSTTCAPRDYLWRWDTDWFWCSKNVGAQHPLLRRLLRTQAPQLAHLHAADALERALGRHATLGAVAPARTSESVIQDVDIPIERAAEFLAFLLREIGILPIWICPIRGPRAAMRRSIRWIPGARQLRLLGRGRKPRPRIRPGTSTA